MSSFKARQPNSYYIRTFGCQMNIHDSEHIAGVLEDSGYAPVESLDKAGLIILNTCSVRASAEDRVWGNLGILSSGNSSQPRVVVCGCMAQRHGLEIIRRFPVVDLVFGMDSLRRLPRLLEKSGKAPICDLGDINKARVDHLPSSPKSMSRAWVPVSHGCDNQCSYCVVPLVRGRDRSRPLELVEEEVRRLASSGVMEVTLLGQNVNSYGRDLNSPRSFAQLLSAVASIQGIVRIFFETSHPRDFTEDIIEVMAERPEVCEHLHLPVQSGSNRVLLNMNRGYKRGFYIERLEKARQLIPDLVISTDIIVGFPGETAQDFRDTLELVKTARFDMAYLFIYSPREGTGAAAMEDDVPRGVKSERFRELSRLQDQITERSLERLVGRTVEVLVEGPAKKGDYVTGRTRGHRVVLLPSSEAPVGSLVKATVNRAGRHAARGEVEDIVRCPGKSEVG